MAVALTFRWGATYTAEHVNRLARQLPIPLVCITDDPTGIECEAMPLWSDLADLPGPIVSCWRRLKLFDPEAQATLPGDRWLVLDLDVTITGDLGPILAREEPFVGWRDPNHPQLCGSAWLLSRGHRPDVWADFDPAASPAMLRAKGLRGSDQAWLSHKLKGCATFGREVVSYKKHCRHGLPAAAHIVCFHGQPKPWAKGLPAWCDPQPGTRRALVLGGAKSVWQDAERALEMAEFDAVIATNDAGARWSGRLDHWCTLHREKLPRWEKERRLRGYPGGYVRWGHAADKRVDRVTTDWRGSSGLFAVKVAIELGYSRIVLAGVPMAADGAHFFSDEAWTAARGYLSAWNVRAKEMAGRVRSMSGWTARLLGEVDERWLTSS